MQLVCLSTKSKCLGPKLVIDSSRFINPFISNYPEKLLCRPIQLNDNILKEFVQRCIKRLQYSVYMECCHFYYILSSLCLCLLPANTQVGLSKYKLFFHCRFGILQCKLVLKLQVFLHKSSIHCNSSNMQIHINAYFTAIFEELDLICIQKRVNS